MPGRCPSGGAKLEVGVPLLRPSVPYSSTSITTLHPEKTGAIVQGSLTLSFQTPIHTPPPASSPTASGEGSLFLGPEPQLLPPAQSLCAIRPLSPGPPSQAMIQKPLATSVRCAPPCLSVSKWIHSLSNLTFAPLFRSEDPLPGPHSRWPSLCPHLASSNSFSAPPPLSNLLQAGQGPWPYPCPTHSQVFHPSLSPASNVASPLGCLPGTSNSTGTKWVSQAPCPSDFLINATSIHQSLVSEIWASSRLPLQPAPYPVHQPGPISQIRPVCLSLSPGQPLLTGLRHLPATSSPGTRVSWPSPARSSRAQGTCEMRNEGIALGLQKLLSGHRRRAQPGCHHQACLSPPFPIQSLAGTSDCCCHTHAHFFSGPSTYLASSSLSPFLTAVPFARNAVPFAVPIACRAI